MIKSLLVKFFFLLTFLFPLIVGAQPDVQWQRCFGGSANEEAHSVKATSDGGQIIAGNTNSSDGDVEYSSLNWVGDKMWILKLNAAGEVEWKTLIPKETGFGVSGYAYSIIECADKSFVVVGTSSTTTNNPIRVVKLSPNGTVIWNKIYGALAEAFDIVEVPGQGYLIAGQTSANSGDVSGNHGSSDVWLLKIDTNGGKEWQKCLGGSKADGATGLKLAPDNGIIITGWTYSKDGDVSPINNATTYTTDAWIVKTDNLGNIQWQKCLGSSDSDKFESVHVTADGNFVAVGYLGTNLGNGRIQRDALVAKFGPSGNILMQNTYGGSNWDAAVDIISGDNDDLVIVGYSASIDGQVIGVRGDSDIWVFALSPTGEIRWQKCLGGSKEEKGYGISRASDGGYVVVGNTQSNDKDVSGFRGGGVDMVGGGDYWVVKLAFDIPSITTGDLTKTDLCLNSQLTIPFTYSKTIPSGTAFQAELSDAAGNFTASTILASSEANQTLSVIIPDNLPASNTYKVRIRSIDLAAFTTTERIITIATQTPVATISGSATILTGQSTTLVIQSQINSPWNYTLSSGQSGKFIATEVIMPVAPTLTTQYTINAIKNACGNGTVTGTPIVTVLKYCYPQNGPPNSCISINNVIIRNKESIIVWRSQNEICQQSYSFKEADPPTLLIGYPYQLQLGRSPYVSYDQHATVWIDMNQDSTFTDNEIVFQSTAGNYLRPTVTSTLTIPPNAKVGFARMRIRSRQQFEGIISSPCAKLLSGETEDYQIYLSKETADLSISQIVSNRTPAVNDLVDVTLTVQNDGPDGADDIVVTEQLPDNLQVIPNSEIASSYDKIVAQIRRLESHESKSFRFQVKPQAAGQYRIAAQVAGSKAYDPDSPANSGTADGQDDSVITDFRTQQFSNSIFTSANSYQIPLPAVQSNQPAPISGMADLSVSLQTNKQAVKIGEVFSLRPKLINANPTTAYSIKVTGDLPDGIEIVKLGYGITVTGRTITYDISYVDNYQNRLLESLDLRATESYSKSEPIIFKFQIAQCSTEDQDSIPGNGYDNGEDDTTQIIVRVY